jgi:hypothetical protein
MMIESTEPLLFSDGVIESTDGWFATVDNEGVVSSQSCLPGTCLPASECNANINLAGNASTNGAVVPSNCCAENRVRRRSHNKH